MRKMFSLMKLLAIAFFFSSLAPCDTLTITITGIANGTWNRDAFANAAFQFTFFVPDIANVAAPPCCGGVRSTPQGTSGTVTIANVGTGAMDPRGDQAVFVNPAAAAAGIWHYNSLDFLSVSNPALSNYDFTNTIAPMTGKTFFYNNRITMSDRVTTLDFTSVSDVRFSVERRPGGGTPGVVSVSPDSLVAPLGVSTLFTFVVSDTAGAGDLQGLNILFSDPPFSDDVPFRYSDPYACWIWYERATKTVSLFVSEGWASAPLGAGGGLLRRGRCVVDTTSATVTESGNFLTLALPIQLTPDPLNPPVYPLEMPIAVRAVNNANVDTGYQRAGQVTLNPSSEPGFIFYTTPSIRDTALGSSTTFKLNVISWGGFNDVIRFSALAYSGNLQYTFDPPAVPSSGTTTLTVSTASLAAGLYHTIVIAGTSSSTKFEHAVAVAVESGPPPVSVRDDAPPEATEHHYNFTLSGTWWGAGQHSINGFNVLFGPAVDGRNACWLFSDGKKLWLAGDDGLTWSLAGPDLATPAANSQCTVDHFAAVIDGFNSGWILGAHIVFKPGFSPVTNKMFVRASNVAGFDSGYTLADVKRN